MTIRQIKFTNGEEILCDVMEWRDEFLVKDAMRIEAVGRGNQKFYVFRPWMHYQESPTNIISVQTSHVTAVADPNTHLKDQYFEAVNDMHDTDDERNRYYLAERMEKLHGIAESVANAEVLDSERNNNIIPFPIN